MANLNAQARFASAPLGLDMPRSTFDRSFNYKSTANAGLLNCFMVDEIYPGDTVDLRAVFMARMTTPVFPVMDSCYLETAVFYVPWRLVWDHWKNFCGENDTSQWVEDQEYFVPQQRVDINSERTVGDLSHQMGIPFNCGIGSTVNGLYHRAYRLIWNEWFRDQNLQDPVAIIKGDQDNDISYNKLLPVNRVHDYFGSCLPAPQKGDAVRIALTGSMPVYASDNASFSALINESEDSSIGGDANTGLKWYRTDTFGAVSSANIGIATSGDYVAQTVFTSPSSSAGSFAIAPDNLVAELSTAGIDVATLRLAVQTQRILERLNLGSRYVEFVRNFFGVTSPDSRQQRPELLGHSKRMINMQEVPQTSSDFGEVGTPLGTVGAYSKTFDDNCKFTHSFTEHGCLIGLYWFRHNRTYAQGINRLFRRKRFEDFYVPQLAHIGDQPVYKTELFNDGDTYHGSVQDTEIFGYQEAWAELRFKPSVAAGLMDPSVENTLGTYWTYTDLYTEAPTLSDEWIREGSAEVQRTLALPGEDQFIIDCNVSYLHTRCLPVFSIPGLVDHF